MDPEKVRRFAEELQRFNSDLENRLILLHTRFAALGDTWSDQEHEKFAEEFKSAMKALNTTDAEIGGDEGRAREDQRFAALAREFKRDERILEIPQQRH